MTPLTTKEALAADATLKAYNEAHPAPPKVFDSAELTDVGNARRLVEKHGQDIRYVAAWKAWMHWNGKIWERLDEDKQGYPQLLKEWAKETANSYRIDAYGDMSPNLADEYLKHAKRSESDAKIKAMLNLITGERGIMKSYKDFDNNPFLFTCQNGTLNLLTQKLQEHKREDCLTKISPVVFDPSAKCEIWITFLNRIMRSNLEMIAYLQNLAGQCLSGEVREKAFWIFWGAGGDNGKTTFIEALQYILKEYGQTVPIAALLRENKGSIPTDLHSLMGARMAYASEPDIGDELTPGMIKRITGKDMMKTRTLHEKPSQWKAEFKLIIATNNQPKISDPSDAMWSRVKCVPFMEKIPLEEMDKQLGEKLKLESSGILNWMLAGCMNWLASGMREPTLITQTVIEYRESSDPLTEWFNYCFVKNPVSGFTPFKIYYPLYKLWCIIHQQRPVAERNLPILLQNRGFLRGRAYWQNAEKEWVQDRGNYGFELQDWLRNSNDENKTDKTPSPVLLILEAMDSDIEVAKTIFDTQDRKKLADSIYLVSSRNSTNHMSNLSDVSQSSERGYIIPPSHLSLSVLPVLLNKEIVILLKQKYDQLNKPDSIQDLERMKINMRNKIILELNEILSENQEIPGNEFIDRIVADYCSVRGW